jgi:hypothetical protein
MMSNLNSLGIGRPAPLSRGLENAEQIVPQHALRRVLAFRRHSIDDIVNDPMVKREVHGYFKLQLQIARTCETVELERQWNSVA